MKEPTRFAAILLLAISCGQAPPSVVSSEPVGESRIIQVSSQCYRPGWCMMTIYGVQQFGYSQFCKGWKTDEIEVAPHKVTYDDGSVETKDLATKTVRTGQCEP